MTTAAELVACQQAVRQVHVDEKVRRYIMQIVHRTRQNEDLTLGASPRASLALFRASQAMAAMLGRNFVQPDDVKRVATAILTHRVILRPESRLRKITAAAVIDEMLREIQCRRSPVLKRPSELNGAGAKYMRWFTGAILILAIALTFGLGLLAYAMYALLGIMLVSRVMSRVWIENLAADRECNRLSANVGDRVAVVVNLRNRGSLPIAWLLMEDLLPLKALIHTPPNLASMAAGCN